MSRQVWRFVRSGPQSTAIAGLAAGETDGVEVALERFDGVAGDVDSARTDGVVVEGAGDVGAQPAITTQEASSTEPNILGEIVRCDTTILLCRRSARNAIVEYQIAGR